MWDIMGIINYYPPPHTHTNMGIRTCCLLSWRLDEQTGGLDYPEKSLSSYVLTNHRLDWTPMQSFSGQCSKYILRDMTDLMPSKLLQIKARGDKMRVKFGLNTRTWVLILYLITGQICVHYLAICTWRICISEDFWNLAVLTFEYFRLTN